MLDLLAKQNLCFYWLFRYKNNNICAYFLMIKRSLKSIVIGRIWKSKAFGTIVWPCYLDEHTKFRFPAVKNALWALESICAPTERHILIAHAITNKDFGASSLASCSPWNLAPHIWELKKRDFWYSLKRISWQFCHELNWQVNIFNKIEIIIFIRNL